MGGGSGLSSRWPMGGLEHCWGFLPGHGYSYPIRCIQFSCFLSGRRYAPAFGSEHRNAGVQQQTLVLRPFFPLLPADECAIATSIDVHFVGVKGLFPLRKEGSIPLLVGVSRPHPAAQGNKLTFTLGEGIVHAVGTPGRPFLIRPQAVIAATADNTAGVVPFPGVAILPARYGHRDRLLFVYHIYRAHGRA